MSIDKIPHKLLVKLYKRMLSRKQDVEERIGTLAAVEQNGILSSCYNFDKIESTDSRQRILRFINDPSRETWDAIYKIQVTGEKNFWKIWTDFDPNAPTEIPACESVIRRWNAFPSPKKLLEKAHEELVTERESLNKEDLYIEATLSSLESEYPVLEKKCRPYHFEQTGKHP